MSDIISSVWQICDQFIYDGISNYVSINDEGISRVAVNIKKELDDMKDHWWGYPKCFKEDSYELPYKMMYYELLADSINYQYWYGKHDIRPNGACATKMYEILDNAFYSVETRTRETVDCTGENVCEEVTKIFIEDISKARFPNLENRVKHIKEVSALIKNKDLDVIKNKDLDVVNYISDKICKNEMSIEEFLDFIITKLPGYAEDMFLKRAFLLPIMLYRRLQWFKDDIHLVPVPADYQIPKVLEEMECINYSYTLSDKIQNGELIPAGSLEECEIRAATILACKKLSELSGQKMCDIDTYLWLKRNEVDKPFHLTVTTNY